MRDVIRVMDVSKSFGEETVLHHISYDFKEGRIYGIVGNNGSGKTVLMKCICGFLIPDSGEIIETPGFLPNLTGMRNLELLASLRKKIDKKAVAEAIRVVGLDPEMKKPVSKYSLGMRQRLGIAQALMEDPSLLILDEPFNGLDKHGVSQMHELILAQKKKGKTILLSSHSQKDIDVRCDVVCEMDGGVMHCIRDRMEDTYAG